MRLFEAIIDANHRAVAGDKEACLHPADFADELPVIALTCIDPRLNAYFPNALGLPAEEFIWLRNAGNIITGPLSSTMRSLALACAVKGGKEIAVIGHTDCQVSRTTTMQLLEKFEAIGVKRQLLPENLTEFFGLFASERQNVIKAVDIIRQSPLIGPKIPVHGLLMDIETGKLEWIVNGYQNLETMSRALERGHEIRRPYRGRLEIARRFPDWRNEISGNKNRRDCGQSRGLAVKESRAVGGQAFGAGANSAGSPRPRRPKFRCRRRSAQESSHRAANGENPGGKRFVASLTLLESGH